MILAKAFKANMKNATKLTALTDSWENAFKGFASPAVGVRIHPAGQT